MFKSPNSFTLVCTISSTSLSFETSATATQALRPLASISLTTAWQPSLLAGTSLMQTS